MTAASIDFDRGFLANLAPEDRVALFAGARSLRFADGEDIVSAGDPAGDVFALIEGRAEVALVSAQGRLVLYRDVLPGDVFGELAALDGGPRTTFVTARGSARVAALSSDAFEALLIENPGVARALLTHLAGSIRRLTERVYEQTALNVRHRLMTELLRRARDAGAPGADAATLAPAPKHAEIAALIGTHREAVTKELSSLDREGLVTKVKGGLRVSSLRLLEAAIGL